MPNQYKKGQTLLATVMHLRGPGTLRAKEGHLVFEPAQGELVPIRGDHLKSLVCEASVEVTSQALRELARRETDVAWLSPQGDACYFRLEQSNSFRAMQRVRQVRAFDTPRWRLHWGKIVAGLKIDGLRAAARHGQRHGAQGAGDLLVQLDTLLPKLQESSTLDQTRGYEGAASAMWYRYFATRVPAPFTFPGRQRRPPPDPVNGLLSLSSTMLTTRVEGLLRARGLEPSLGALHCHRSGRASLACDMMEPFRPNLVDRWTLRALRSGLVTTSDFHFQAGKGVRLREQSFRKVVVAWEEEYTAGDYPGHIQNLIDELIDSWGAFGDPDGTP